MMKISRFWDQTIHINSASNTADVLDVTILKHFKWTVDQEVQHALLSDHLPVLIETHTRNDITDRKYIIQTGQSTKTN